MGRYGRHAVIPCQVWLALHPSPCSPDLKPATLCSVVYALAELQLSAIWPDFVEGSLVDTPSFSALM